MVWILMLDPTGGTVSFAAIIKIVPRGALDFTM
jgi:hypothetical protein